MSFDAVRERDALLRLACFRKLNTAHLEAFVFDGSGVRPHSREVTTRRILGRLRRRGLIAASPRLVGGPGGGSARLVYHLTEAGCRFVGTIDRSLRGRHPPARDSLMIEHALMTADVALAFMRAARSHPGHDVSEFEPDWRAAGRLGSSRVVPDGHLVYATEAWEVDAFVEVDLGTESRSRFARKIAEYIAVLRSGTWRAQLQSWPLVLTVTPTAARATALRRVTEDVLRPERDAERLAKVVEFDFAALPDLLGAKGPLGEIWQIAGRDGIHALISPDVEDTPIDDPASSGTPRPGALPSLGSGE